LSVMAGLPLTFYTVESLERERTTGLFPVLAATPVRTLSVLGGKVLASGGVGVVVLLAEWLAAWVVLLIQRKASMDVLPFALVWGGLLLPTFLLWAAYLLLLHSLAGNRYATYALALATLILFGW